MREHEIEGLSAQEIQHKYSLTDEPKYVSDVLVPENTQVRAGTAEANFGGQRGATQFELLYELSGDRFTNQRELPK